MGDTKTDNSAKTSQGCQTTGCAGIGLVALIGAIAVLGTQADPDSDFVGEPSDLAELQSRVAEGAVEVMEPEDYSDTFGRIGAEAFERANLLAPWAAYAALSDDRCPRAELVAISDRATTDELVWFVDCAGGERFFISEPQAVAVRARLEGAEAVEDASSSDADPVRPESARWEDFDEADAVSQCDFMTQRAMLHPESFSTGWNRWTTERDSAAGTVTFERPFTANAAIGELNSRYRCTINADENRIVSLSILEGSEWTSIF